MKCLEAGCNDRAEFKIRTVRQQDGVEPVRTLPRDTDAEWCINHASELAGAYNRGERQLP